MKKCRYCGKELDSNLEFCSSECENSYRKIIEKDRHKTKYFISGIILGFLVMFYGVVSSRNCMLGSGIIVMGVTVVLLPFTTPETTVLFGNKKARFIGRILGMLLIAGTSSACPRQKLPDSRGKFSPFKIRAVKETLFERTQASFILHSADKRKVI